MKHSTGGAVVGVLLLWSSAARADASGSWQYLVDRLVADGLDPAPVQRAFADPRMAPFDGLEFSPGEPRETHALYRQFLKPTSVARARACRVAYAAPLEAAAQHYGVPPSVLASIFYVETGCGRNTGSYVILQRLARLAMANEPENLQRNFDRFTSRDGRLDPVVEERLRARARYLETTFYPEVRATFAVAQQIGVNPLDLRGSSSGAFGYPQFLPSSYLQYGVDADGDGVVSLYAPGDAAASEARYLAAYGWQSGITRAEERQVIWHYNHSDAYIDTVLALAARIDAAPMIVPTKGGNGSPKPLRPSKPRSSSSSKPKMHSSSPKPRSGSASRRPRA